MIKAYYKFKDIKSKLSLKEIYKIYHESISELKELFPNEEFAFKLSKELFFARCGTLFAESVFNSNNTGYIVLTDYGLAGDKEIVKNTIIHELLHFYPNCIEHDGEWQKKADIVNSKYHYEIEEIGFMPNEFIKEFILKHKERYKYMSVCLNCGTIEGYGHFSKIYQDPSKYTCRHCNANQFIVSEI